MELKVGMKVYVEGYSPVRGMIGVVHHQNQDSNSHWCVKYDVPFSGSWNCDDLSVEYGRYFDKSQIRIVDVGDEFYCMSNWNENEID